MMNNRVLSSSRLPHLCCALLIVVAGAVCYCNTLSSPFVFDDNHAILDNTHLRSLHNFMQGMNLANRRYITNLTLLLNYQAGGTQPQGYHIVNIVIHIAAGLSAYWLAYMLFALTGSRPNTTHKAIAHGRAAAAAPFRREHFFGLAIALLFVAHPLQTQSVTYIIQRASSLSGFFYLLTLALYLKAFFRRAEKDYAAWYAGSLASCCIGMFTKENFFTAPLAILLCEYMFLRKRRNSSWAGLRLAAPFLATMALLPALLYLNPAPEAALSHGVGVVPAAGRHEYFLTQFRSLAIYAALFFFPAGQRIEYHIPKAVSPFEPDVLLGIAAVCGVILSAVLLLRKYPLYSFGIFFTFLALAVESSFVSLPDFCFEHRMYLPVFGLLLALAGLVFPMSGAATPFVRRTAGISVAVAVMALGAATIARNSVWSSAESLWRDAIAKEPGLPRPYLGLGQAFASSGRFAEALPLFRQSLALDSTADEVMFNIGLAHAYLQSPPDSVRYWMEKALFANIAPSLRAVAPHILSAEQVVAKNDILTLQSLYFSFVKRRAAEQLIALNNAAGKPEAAAAIAERVVAAFPDRYCSLYNDLGVFYVKMRDFGRALANLDKARKCGFGVAPEFYQLVENYARRPPAQ